MAETTSTHTPSAQASAPPSHPPTARAHHRHHAHAAAHAQFARQEKADTCVPPHIKAWVIERTPKRRPPYDATKVLVRNETNYVSSDFMTIAREKARRMEEVRQRGFFANSRETYKSLGEPTTDSELLMFERLELNTSIQKRQTPSKSVEGIAKTKDVANLNQAMISQGNSTIKKASNGCAMLKSRIQASRARLFAVKFGTPFGDVCTLLTGGQVKRRSAYAAQVCRTRRIRGGMAQPGFARPGSRSDGPPICQAEEIDYRNLVLDPAKMAYYLTLVDGASPEADAATADPAEPMELPKLGNFLAAFEARTGPASAAGVSTCSPPVLPSAPAAGNFFSHEGWSGTLTARGDQKASAVRPPAPLQKAGRPSTTPKTPSLPPLESAEIKALEQALKITKPQTADSLAHLLQAQEAFYQNQDKLNQTLVNELSKLDAERPVTFMLKYQAFNVSTHFVNDIARMRRHVRAQKISEQRRHIREHRWFGEMVKSVFYCNGTKSELSPIEERLLRRIRNHIEGNLEWNQAVIISLLKMIPPAEFPNLQKVVRFIKTAESMGEREYLEAIELSGHTV